MTVNGINLNSSYAVVFSHCSCKGSGCCLNAPATGGDQQLHINQKDKGKSAVLMAHSNCSHCQQGSYLHLGCFSKQAIFSLSSKGERGSSVGFSAAADCQ